MEFTRPPGIQVQKILSRVYRRLGSSQAAPKNLCVAFVWDKFVTIAHRKPRASRESLPHVGEINCLTRPHVSRRLGYENHPAHSLARL
jgi:hypothetical protein